MSIPKWQSPRSQNEATWEELLAVRAAEAADRQAVAFVEGGQIQEQWSYGELLRRSDAIAAWLQQRFEPGDRLALLFPAGLDFVEAFFGCTRAGLIPVPLSPSLSRHHYASILPILENCSAAAVLGPELLWKRQQSTLSSATGIPQIAWLDWDSVKAKAWGMENERKPAYQGGIAFLQYTSGSTGNPKGVRVGHASLTHNLQQIIQACGITQQTSMLSWMPHFHDMGLIGGILQTIYSGSKLSIMAPGEFTRRPILWLETISSNHIDLTVASDSALQLVERAARPELITDLDLSRLDCIVCGSEPIRRSIVDQFQKTFRHAGLKNGTLLCAFGLAEATLMVTASRYQCAVGDSGPDSHGGNILASSGECIDGLNIQIVDPQTMVPVETGQEGLIFIKGTSVNQGYWNSQQASESTFDQNVLNEGGFLNTGDLGKLVDGQLYVCGRIKDLIIVGGRNIYPTDVEAFVASLTTAFGATRCIAFARLIPNNGERVVILLESPSRRLGPIDTTLLSSIGAAVGREFGVQVQEILLLEPQALPVTTSGKLRRQEAKKLHGESRFKPLARWPLTNMAATSAGTILPMIKRAVVALAGLDPFLIDADQSLAELIQGSLQLAELKVRLDQQLDADLPIEPFLADLTLRQLADQLSSFMISSQAAETIEASVAAAGGSGASILEDSPSLRQLMVSGLPDHLCQLRQQHGDFVTLRWGRQLIHLLSDPQEVENLMQRPAEEFIRGKVFEGIRMVTDGSNLFTTEGPAWLKERHRAQPLFRRPALEAMAVAFAPIARACLKQRLAGRLSADLDLAELSRAITLECTLHQLFGTIPEPLRERLAAALQEATDWQLPLHYLAGADLARASSPRTGASIDGLLPILDELIFGAIDDQLTASLRPNTMLGAYLSDADVEAMEAGERRSYLRSVMLSLMLAGLESTGSGLYFSLDLLARHPEVQQRVSAEVRDTFAQGEIDPEDLSRQLPYTLATVLEALRLYPPVWFLGREAVAATEVLGHSVAPGDIVLTSPYVIHRHPDHWQEPACFRPERFLHKPMAGPGSHLYFPFGVGPRTCVGRWLALYEITLAMAALVQWYQLSSDGEERPALSSYFTLKTLKPITLRVEAYR